jgi:hypothetical protein
MGRLPNRSVSISIEQGSSCLIQGNNLSAGKEVSVLNGARRFINVVTRSYHRVISTDTISKTSILILSYHLRLTSSLCVNKRHPSHLTELQDIKIYSLVYARNEMENILKLILE